MTKRRMKSMDGNTAAAYASYAFTDVAAIYPITPSSDMAQHIDEWAATGKVTIDLPPEFGDPAPDGDWWPTTLEPMVREMFDARRATSLPSARRRGRR